MRHVSYDGKEMTYREDKKIKLRFRQFRFYRKVVVHQTGSYCQYLLKTRTPRPHTHTHPEFQAGFRPQASINQHHHHHGSRSNLMRGRQKRRRNLLFPSVERNSDWTSPEKDFITLCLKRRRLSNRSKIFFFP